MGYPAVRTPGDAKVRARNLLNQQRTKRSARPLNRALLHSNLPIRVEGQINVQDHLTQPTDNLAYGLQIGRRDAWEEITEIQARMFAQVSARLWHLGDGQGGWVLKVLGDALSEVGIGPADVKPQFRNLVERLAERDGWECHYCRAALGYGHSSVLWPEADHMVSRANGGPDAIENRVLSCTECNRRKGRRNHDDFCGQCS